MNLYRFTAESNHKAMSKVNEALGPEALIHSINRISEGVEILAALPQSEDNIVDQHFLVEDLVMKNTSITKSPMENFMLAEKFSAAEEIIIKPDQRMMENLNIQMQIMDINIQKLANQINVLYQVVTDKVKKKKTVKWNLLKFISKYRKTSKEGAYGTQTA